MSDFVVNAIEPMPLPTVLSLEAADLVSGGGSNVQHGNSGGEPASYNVHRTPAGAGPAFYNLS